MIPRGFDTTAATKGKEVAPKEPTRYKEIEVEDIEVQFPTGVVQFTLWPGETIVIAEEGIRITKNSGETIDINPAHVYVLSRLKAVRKVEDRYKPGQAVPADSAMNSLE